MTGAIGLLGTEVTTGASTFRVRGGFTGLYWKNPAARLSRAARRLLRSELVPVAVDTFTGTTEDFWLEWLADEKLDDLSGLVVVFDDGGRPVGWVAGNIRTFGGRTCFYANSAGVHPDVQSLGLSSAMWRQMLVKEIVRSAPRRLHAVMRTANPLVYSAWAAAAGGIERAQPSPITDVVPDDVLRIAADVASHLGQLDRLDPATLVIRDAYENTDNGLWLERPTSAQQVVDDWMRSLLGPRDAVVLVVVFDPVPLMIREVARQLLRRMGVAGWRSSRSSRGGAG